MKFTLFRDLDLKNQNVRDLPVYIEDHVRVSSSMMLKESCVWLFSVTLISTCEHHAFTCTNVHSLIQYLAQGILLAFANQARSVPYKGPTVAGNN